MRILMVDTKKGFTIVEILVVISIIGLLMAVVMTSITEVRANARDKQRAEDLGRIEAALDLYLATYLEYPCETTSNCSNQTETANGNLGEGNYIDELLAEFMTTIPVDPLRDKDSNYYYYIDPNQTCGGSNNKIVIFANTMETNKYKNADSTICSSWDGEGGAGNSDSYMIIVGDSTDG